MGSPIVSPRNSPHLSYIVGKKIEKPPLVFVPPHRDMAGFVRESDADTEGLFGQDPSDTIDAYSTELLHQSEQPRHFAISVAEYQIFDSLQQAPSLPLTASDRSRLPSYFSRYIMSLLAKQDLKTPWAELQQNR